MSAFRRRLPWIWTGTIGTVSVLALTLGGAGGNSVDSVLAPVTAAVIALIAGFGAVVSARQPGNRIAWLFQATSVLFLVVIGSSMVVETFDPLSPGFWDYIAIFVLDGISLAMFHAVFLLLYLFPTGRFLTPRWTWAGWSGAVLMPSSFLAIVFSDELSESFAEDGWQISNPIGFLPSSIFEFISLAWALVLMVVAVGGVASMIVRYRRSDMLIRTQIKWVLFAAIIATICLPIGWGDFPLAGLFLTISLLIIPAGVTVAIARYKLYEIDRLISRTISYVLVVGLLGAVFAAGTVWLPSLFLGEQTPILVAGSTLAVAALFNPLRIRVQRMVDRKFNRSSYEAEKVIEKFATQLQESLTAQQLANTWMETVDTHFEPAVLGIWLNQPESEIDAAQGRES